MISKIHLIENLGNIKALDIKNAEFETKWWDLAEATANKLVGGEIYFHKFQAKPSFYGGKITSYRIETEGQWKGRVIFNFTYNEKFRNVSTGKDKWAMEMKIDLCQ